MRTLFLLLWVSLACLQPGFGADATSLPEAKESDTRLHADGKGWRLDKAKVTDPKLPRVLLIGDSILNGYLKSVVQSLEGKAYVDAWVNPYNQSDHLNKLLAEVLANGPYDVVHFNMGLHGWQEGRIKPGTFEPLTKAYVDVLKTKLPKAKVIWASSTPVTVQGKPTELDAEINPVIVEHNRMAARVMAEMNVPVNDFYALLVGKLELARGDRFHWKPAAYQILANRVTETVLQELGKTERPRKVLPLPGEVFEVEGCTAFVIQPATKSDQPWPWVWYAPTLPNLPGKEERWMFERFLEAGIAIAGIDVGESYGSPKGRGHFTALYMELTEKRGFSRKPVLLGRSRGGLMTLNWAAENPDKVGGFAGIYPVCNLTSYPGISKAAPAYSLSPEALEKALTEHNPVDRLGPLAKAGIPLFAIHGDVDTLVPLDANSAMVKSRYTELGGQMELIVPKGQGHNMWTGFFQCEELVEFVKSHAKP